MSSSKRSDWARWHVDADKEKFRPGLILSTSVYIKNSDGSYMKLGY
ncbi:MAG: hypothetical protein OJF51_000887 [Nitrospira sp.]|nr:MAG: hypothetical protein OJF51_000887 [Nitrospira sp.]